MEEIYRVLVEDARPRVRMRAAGNILKTEEICWMYEKTQEYQFEHGT